MTGDPSGQLYRVYMPARIRALPRTRAGYPIPYFAATVNGERDLRIADQRAVIKCARADERLCWICGQRRSTAESVFVAGPLCAVNRISGEAPSHTPCAEYAAQVCPFLARPAMSRRDRGMPGEVVFPGKALLHNPGVTLVWSAKNWKAFHPNGDRTKPILFHVGEEPSHVSWWAEGRPALRGEVLAAIDNGMPMLQSETGGNKIDLKLLDEQRAAAMAYVPDA